MKHMMFEEREGSEEREKATWGKDDGGKRISKRANSGGKVRGQGALYGAEAATLTNEEGTDK